MTRLEEHARNDTIQACVLLVSARFGEEAGEWLLCEMQSFNTIVMRNMIGRTPALFAEYREEGTLDVLRGGPR